MHKNKVKFYALSWFQSRKKFKILLKNATSEILKFFEIISIFFKFRAGPP